LFGLQRADCSDTQHSLIGLMGDPTRAPIDTTRPMRRRRGTRCCRDADAVPTAAYYGQRGNSGCENLAHGGHYRSRWTSGAKLRAASAKTGLRYGACDDVSRCPAGGRGRTITIQRRDGTTLRRYGRALQTCALKAQARKGPERRISRWEHEAVWRQVQVWARPQPTQWVVPSDGAEHPFGLRSSVG